MFDPYLQRWNLVADGGPIATRTNHLLPVRHQGEAAMLKLVGHEDERRGAAILEWWAGAGAARVHARDGDAVLMERAEGPQSLADMARSGRDNDATRVLCNAAQRLHAGREAPLPELVPLDQWFRDLWPAADKYGGLIRRSAEVARALLDDQREVVVLHGDLHHGNVLDFGARGWLAIDPKGLIGDRCFDYANIFTNPDLDDPTSPVAVSPERFSCRVDIVAEAAKIEKKRLLQWVLAWTGLSAVWYLGDGDAAEIDLSVAKMAAAALQG
jgi:streptomycin 6-kinase